MKHVLLLAAILIGAFGSGFSWNFESDDPCASAGKLSSQLVTSDNPHLINETEQRILTSCPNGPPGIYVKGVQRAQQGDLDGAIALFRDVLTKEPEFAPASASLGLAYAEKGQDDEAAVELTKGLAAGSSSQVHASLGRIFTNKGLYSLALYHYAEAQRLSPDSPDILAGQGEAYAGMGQTARAEELFRRVLSTDSGNKRARTGLDTILAGLNSPARSVVASTVNGNSSEASQAAVPIPQSRSAELMSRGDELFASKEYVKAIEFYSAALASRPEWPEAQLKLADAYNVAGKEEEAIAAYRKALGYNIHQADIHYNLGVLYERKGLLDEAIVEYRQALSLHSDNGDVRRRLADIYTLRGSFPQAIEQYREILKTKNDNPVVHFKLGRVLTSTHALPEAISEYTQSLQLDNDNIAAHRELAILYRKVNRLPEAEKEYREILRLKKDDQDSRNAITAILVKDKRYDELAALLQEGVDMDPTNSMSHYKLGLVYEYVKKYGEAEAAYQKAIELKADNAKALNALGRIYMKTSRIPEARQALEAAKKADPELEEPGVLLNSIKEELNPEPRKTWKKSKSKKGKSSKKSKKKVSKSKKSTSKKAATSTKKTTKKTTTKR